MKNNKFFLVLLISALSIIIILGGGYTYWNAAAPEKTCASCHEIQKSIVGIHASAHREFKCNECHGTALSNGIHSLKEKSNMVFTHIAEEVKNENIHLKEEQVLAVSQECIRCHQSEHKNWLAGGHSASYKDIFLDSTHNSIEAPYPDCFRCHGMFYDGTINDLMEPLSTTGPWHLKDPEKTDDPTVPCLACHQTHSENEIITESSLDSLRNPAVSLYIRSDKIYLRADKLLKPLFFHKGREVRVSDDHSQRLCEHCHSPNTSHAVGSQDDRTPIGVHEGLACNSCHKPHSNDARRSCVLCHPAISNCKLDVTTMNTTYLDPDSPNNIHFVSCKDCHASLKETAF